MSIPRAVAQAAQAPAARTPPWGARARAFSGARVARDADDLARAQHMLDTGYVPANNHLARRAYTLPRTLLESWRQLRARPRAGFKDVCLVKLRSGDGGDGKVSFLRGAGHAIGPPDGGTGGQGGSVFVQASPNVSSLRHLRHIYRAQNGRAGGSTQLTGARGANVVLNVPVGTRVFYSPPIEELRACAPGADLATAVDVVANLSRARGGEAIQLARPAFADGVGGWTFKERDERAWMANPHFRSIVDKVKRYDLINRREERAHDLFPLRGLDLDAPGAPVLLLRGGLGGLGNMHFQTTTLRSPSMAKKGRSGLELTVFMELRMLADVGLVGLPNAGKSTLVRAVSRARPKVGAYAFTTLVPSLATVNVGADGAQLTIADIPGIIRGASANRGMGLGFLRHVERCRCLALLVALDAADPVADAELLLAELGPGRLEGKRLLVVATKADLDGSEPKFEQLRAYAAGRGWDIVPCSALHSHVDGVVSKMAHLARVDEPAETAQGAEQVAGTV